MLCPRLESNQRPREFKACAKCPSERVQVKVLLTDAPTVGVHHTLAKSVKVTEKILGENMLASKEFPSIHQRSHHMSTAERTRVY